MSGELLARRARRNAVPPRTFHRHFLPAGAEQVKISWQTDDPGFVLQERTNLFQGDWLVARSGATNPVQLRAAGFARFFRLSRH